MAAEPRPHGVFSNMHVNPKTGDVLGIEILVVNSSKGCHALFQSAEGEPRVPKLVPCRVSGNRLELTLPADARDYTGRFEAGIRRDGLVGKFDSKQLNYDMKEKFFLKRGRSFWQR